MAGEGVFAAIVAACPSASCWIIGFGVLAPTAGEPAALPAGCKAAGDCLTAGELMSPGPMNGNKRDLVLVAKSGDLNTHFSFPPTPSQTVSTRFPSYMFSRIRQAAFGIPFLTAAKMPYNGPTTPTAIAMSNAAASGGSGGLETATVANGCFWGES